VQNGRKLEFPHDCVNGHSTQDKLLYRWKERKNNSSVFLFKRERKTWRETMVLLWEFNRTPRGDYRLLIHTHTHTHTHTLFCCAVSLSHSHSNNWDMFEEQMLYLRIANISGPKSQLTGKCSSCNVLRTFFQM